LEERAEVWIERMSTAPVAVPAELLYRGEYWREGLALANAAASRGPTEVSVVSAGLGLIRGDTGIPSYAATFTRGHPDSVVGGSDAAGDRRRWWEALADWDGPERHRPEQHRPRRLAGLAHSPGARFIVCVGREYIDAVADDLRAAHKVLGDDRLMIIASGPAPEGLSEVWVHCPGRLRMRLGGSMASTGVRAARVILEELGTRGRVPVAEARAVIDTLLRDAAPLPHFNRVRLSDDEVLAWIRRDARSNTSARNKSAALRRLRDSGRACEQARFAELYDDAMRATP
jgi:hypothetical protein